MIAFTSTGCTQPDDEDGDLAISPRDREDRFGTIEQGLLSCGAFPGGALIPMMSSNTSPSGLVTRSGVYSSSYEAWQAFDATTTIWLSNMNTSSVWIGYEWGGATPTVTSYEIKYANGSCCEQRGPKNWTLQGWNGSIWVTVDTVTNQTGWYTNPNRTYTVDTPAAYPKYRLNVTADNYNNATYPITLVSIGSLQLYGSIPASTGGLIPLMSSNTSPSGLVARSGIYSSSYEAWQAFDATSTLWLSNMNTSSVWISYEWGGTTQTVTSYEIKYANGSCCEQRGPKNWTLQGWNGSTWVTVDTVTNQTGWYTNPNRTYIVDTPAAYSKYRLNVTADNYNNTTYPITLVSIASLQLYGATPSPIDGLSIWNADIEKATPACTIIELANFPAECYGSGDKVYLNTILSNSAGSLISCTDSITSATPFIVLYNIRADVVQEVGLTLPADVPSTCLGKLTISSTPGPVSGFPVVSSSSGVTRFSAGAPWGGTGFPRDGGGMLIDFTDVALGAHPCHSHVEFQLQL